MAAIFVPPRIRITDDNSMPVSGALVTFYEAGTTTLKSIYQDAALTIEHTNPVEADSAGLLPVVYLPGAYKIRVTDADGNLVFPEVDNLDAPLSGSGGILGVSAGGTGGGTEAAARASLGVPSQSTFDALASQVGSMQSTINGYPTFGALAAKSKLDPGDLSSEFAPTCIQRLVISDSARRVLSGIIPADNTQPLRNEGDTVFSTFFTPKSGLSKIRIKATVHLATSGRLAILALFNTIGATDPAIAVTAEALNASTLTQPLVLEHEFASPGTAQFTLQVNSGANASYVLNGSTTAGLFNGLLVSTLVIEEYLG